MIDPAFKLEDHTMWGFPSYKMVYKVKPMNTIVIGTKKHTYWSYMNPYLAIENDGPTLYLQMQNMVFVP